MDVRLLEPKEPKEPKDSTGPEPSPPAKGPKKHMGIIVGGAAGLAFVGLVVAQGMMTGDQPVTPHDRQSIISAGDFAPWVPDLVIDPEIEKYTKTFSSMDCTELDYEYVDEDQSVVIVTSLSIESDSMDATLIMVGFDIAVDTIAEEDGWQSTQCPGELDWAESAKCALFTFEGKVMGAAAAARADNRVVFFTAVVPGLDPAGIDPIMKQAVAKLNSY